MAGVRAAACTDRTAASAEARMTRAPGGEAVRGAAAGAGTGRRPIAVLPPVEEGVAARMTRRQEARR